jgi:hypothetical protein
LAFDRQIIGEEAFELSARRFGEGIHCGVTDFHRYQSYGRILPGRIDTHLAKHSQVVWRPNEGRPARRPAGIALLSCALNA